MSNYGRPRTTKGLATLCCKIAEDKLARDIVILDLTEIENNPADYFIICTCEVDVHLQAVAYEIDEVSRELRIQTPRLEGLESNWVLVDFFDVVVHVMLPESREYYKLEKLWSDAKFYKINEEGKLHKITGAELKSIIK